MKRIIFPCIILVSLLLHPSFVSAHRPTYVDGNTQVQVQTPDVSQAFYGELPGQPVTYTIAIPQPMNLYVGILAPDQENARTDSIVDIYDPNQIHLFTLEGSTWEKYFEEFARDDYLKGPEYKTDVPAGEYTLVVSNADNQGKYVLVVGTKESFPLMDMPTIFDQLIKVKVHTFNKPWYSAFMNIFGISIGIALVILLVIMVGIILVTRKIVAKKKKTSKKK